MEPPTHNQSPSSSSNHYIDFYGHCFLAFLYGFTLIIIFYCYEFGLFLKFMEWKEILCILWCLAPSALCLWDLSKLLYAHFHCYAMFHNMNIPQFIYPFYCWWMFALFLVWVFMNIYVHVFWWTYIYISEVLILRSTIVQTSVYIFNFSKYCQFSQVFVPIYCPISTV